MQVNSYPSLWMGLISKKRQVTAKGIPPPFFPKNTTFGNLLLGPSKGTWPFREPRLFLSLPTILTEHFKRVKGPITIHNCACSEGLETLSLALCLQTELGKNAQKFPIVASDLYPETFAAMAEGQVDHPAFKSPEDYYRQEWPLVQAFLPSPYLLHNGNGTYQLSPLLQGRIRFIPEPTDLISYIEHIDKRKPCVVTIRNCWRWMEQQEIQRIREALKSLPERSLVIIGNLEREQGTYSTDVKYSKPTGAQILTEAGFRPITKPDSALAGKVDLWVFEKV